MVGEYSTIHGGDRFYPPSKQTGTMSEFPTIGAIDQTYSAEQCSYCIEPTTARLNHGTENAAERA